MSFLYFAYGSNLLPARLTARCPSARVVGSAMAMGYGLDFSKPGGDGSGKATLVPGITGQSPGALYEIDYGDLPALDKAEVAGIGYERVDDFPLQTADGPIVATTYVAIQWAPDLQPYDWYLALIVAGAQHHGLTTTHVAQHPYIPDQATDRPGRATAMDALRAHGHEEVGTLLSILR